MTKSLAGVAVLAVLLVSSTAEAQWWRFWRPKASPVVSGSLAVTGVSGTLSHGSTITVTGSGFGTKPASTPWKFDTFNGTNAVTMNTDPRGWLVHTNLPYPSLSNAQTRATPSRTTSVMVGQTGNDVPGFAFGDNIGDYLTLTSSSSGNTRTPPTPNVLLDFWMYWAPGGSANNYKFLRWHSTNNPGSNNHYWSAPGGSGFTDTNYTDPNGGFSNLLTNTGMTGWHHYQHLITWFSPVYIVLKFDNVKYMDSDGSGNYIASTGTPSGVTFGPWTPFVSGAEYVSTFQLEMQNDTLGSGARNAKYYIEDLLVDSGFNRVEVSNNATYTSATHTEIQSYTAWADGSISVTLNVGTFASAANVFVHVCNTANVCSTGFPVTFA